MADTDAKYQYEQLDTAIASIRVLNLESPRSDGIIVCSLTNIQLSVESYTALSYMWEPNRPEYELKEVMAEKHKILLDQVEHEVGRNLWHFLRAAQDSGFSTNLWVDALCIDQNNASERNEQVSMMGHIYSRAEKVIVWLGPGSDSTRVFFSMLPDFKPGELANSNAMVIRHTEDKQRQFIAGYHEISTNQCWHRAWILQEVSLAKEVIIKYGPDEMSWDIFRSSFVSLLKDMGFEVDPLFQQVGLQRYTRLDRKAIYEVFQCRSGRYRQRDNLCNIVRKNFSRQCKLVHDRVLFLLSLASDGSAVEVNYNWTPVQLWEHIVSKIGNGVLRHGVYLLNTLEASAEGVLRLASREFLEHQLQIKLSFSEIQYVVHTGGMAARSYWNDSKTAYVTETELYRCSCPSCNSGKSVLRDGIMAVHLPGGSFKLLFEERTSMSPNRVFEPIGYIVDSLEGSINSSHDYKPESLEARGFGVVVNDNDFVSDIDGLSIKDPKPSTGCFDVTDGELGLELHLTRKHLVNIWKHRHYDRDLLGDAQNGFGEWKHNARWDANTDPCFFTVMYDYGKHINFALSH